MSNPYESSGATFSRPDFNFVQIKRVGVLSCGKVLGILYAALGLIAGGFMALFTLAGAGAGADPGAAGFALGMGVGAIIIAPLMYGVIGFIGGIIMAFLYNLAAGAIGGIEIETTGSL